ncbi:hypothetical protein EFK50_07930 [Nocardioides marmoriginsengisoli]|uniref:Uncharacterized protein n=1 Tax=Nocardioides marmoriginsengisoli TaxID=661483 RepID=A0A3N0CL64_9ACTN|nr:hypothetical protein [Nocardioides marmoriginsengisoli]RNL63663.1 hypothetical protein EFK50_07930 [Nocardioides marmoriginsengisoli]
MSGRSKQDLTKRDKRSVDMSPTAEELALADMWKRPPEDECEESNYPSALPGADEAKIRLNIRMVRHQVTWALVEFSIVLLTMYRGRWREVAEIDSCHDDDFHVHQNGRSIDARVGDPVTLGVIRTLEDVQEAYNLALTKVEDEWSTLKDRWHHG